MSTNSESGYPSPAVEELVLGLGSTSGRTHLIIMGESASPEPFCKKFQQVTCIPTLDSGESIDGHEIQGLASNIIVLCLNCNESLPTHLSQTIVDWYNRDAIVVRISDSSEELHNSFLRGTFLRAFERQVDAKPIFLSLLMPVNGSAASRAVGIYDREIQSAVRQALNEDVSEVGKKDSTESRPPLAIMSCYNEEDIIEEIILDYRRQGCELLVLDNWSTDSTWEILERLHELDPRGIEVQRFPDRAPSAASWRAILARKEEIALQHPGRWVLHVDADELRRSPFEELTLAQALRVAQICGANRIDFNVLNFRPVHGGEWSGSLERAFRYFQFPDHLSYFSQKKAWVQGYERVKLVDDAGHLANFDGAWDFRYKFLVKHYPIRSVHQGRNKLHRHREARWEASEKDAGWHVHNQSIMSRYSSLIWPVEELHEFNSNSFREEYGLVVATTLAYFLSPLANGRRVDPQYWSDPDEAPQLTRTLEETQSLLANLRTETQETQSSLADLRTETQETQSSLANLTTKTQETQSSLADLRTETQEAQSLLANLRTETQETQSSLADLRTETQETQSSLADLRTETQEAQSLLANLRTETRSLNDSLQAERSSVRSGYRQQVAGLRCGIWTRLLDRFRSERTILSESRLVDAEWYLRNYPDVVENPVDHYIKVGAREGRDPNPLFSTKAYLKLNPDVAISGMNPLVHFVRYGAAEGRRFSE
jgi:glycosyltransferase involved in cell wall biosynthesis